MVSLSSWQAQAPGSTGASGPERFDFEKTGQREEFGVAAAVRIDGAGFVPEAFPEKFAAERVGGQPALTSAPNFCFEP